MKTRFRPLTLRDYLRFLVVPFIAFFFLLLAPSAAYARQKPPIAHEAGGVSIRTISGTKTAPVQIIADKKLVRVGEPVTFRLTPASIVKDRRYRVTVDFGDGTMTEANRTQLTHTYRTLGHYDVSASVVGSVIEFMEPDPTPQVFRISLFARPNSVVAGKPVTFSARGALRNANIKYRFVFGDKNQTDWQDQSETTHVYRTTGKYQAYVDLGVSDNGAIKQVAASGRQQIEVIHAPFGALDLAANPTSASAGQPVTFTARSGSNDPNVKYRFSFGDGSSTGWQDSSQTMHSFTAAGKFQAHVDFGLMGNGVVRQVGTAYEPVKVASKPVIVTPKPDQVTPKPDQIASKPTVAVSFALNPTSPEPGKVATFTAHVVPKDPNIKYRFVFGDRTRPTRWQDSPQATHKYKVAGNYPAHVEIGRLNNGRLNTIATSNTQQVSVTSPVAPSPSPSRSTSVTAGPSSSPGLLPRSSPLSDGRIQFGSASPTSASISTPGNRSDSSPAPGGLPENWWKYPIIALLLIIIGYQVWKLFFIPQMLLLARPDSGSSDVNGGLQELPIDSQIILDPNVSEGIYLVFTDEANVVRSVRRENG